MPSWLIRVRDIVWTSVFAVIFVIIAVLTAILAPNSIGLIIGAGFASITMAILSLRE
jgi:hypothetical protein